MSPAWVSRSCWKAAMLSIVVLASCWPVIALSILLLRLDQQLVEIRHVPDVLLPVEARRPGPVPGAESLVFRLAVDALEPALAAAAANSVWVSLDSHHLQKSSDSWSTSSLFQVVSTKGWPPIFAQRTILPSAPRRPGCLGEGDLAGDLRGLGADGALGKADPVDVVGDLALAEQLVGLEDVHGPGLHHRRHVLDQREIVLERLDRLGRVDHTFGLALGRLGLVPDARRRAAR